MNNLEKLITKKELYKELDYLDDNPYDIIDNNLKEFLTENFSEQNDYYYKDDEYVNVRISDKVPPVKDEYEEITEFIISFYRH